MSDDDDEYSMDGTRIAFEYGELNASVTMGSNLSPDYVHTITRDLAREIVAAAKDLGMAYQASAPAEASADEA